MRRGEIKEALREVERDLKTTRAANSLEYWRELDAKRTELRERLDDFGPLVRRRCLVCGKAKPDEETTLVTAKIGGDYRRASRWGEVRVCIDCTQARVDFVRSEQTKPTPTNTPLNSRIKWEHAARRFGIAIAGLRTEQMTDRVAE